MASGFVVKALIGLATLLSAAAAYAQAPAYPVRPAKLVLAFGTGGSADVIGRLLAGERKFRFQFPNENGDAEYTDNAAMAIDAAVPITG